MEIKELTKAEMEIMRVIWGAEGLFLAEIVDRIPAPRPAYTTVSTVVRTLVSKGFVIYSVFGKSNRYEAAISKAAYSSRAIAQMQSDLFDGSYAAMFSFFARAERVSAEERRELLAMLAECDDCDTNE
ncbi:MAG: BlaI/MecI/CopY family transcriptional regulator [Rikenellaceae bacterium]